MPTVAIVRLRHALTEYWFDPNGIEAKEGDHVVVETAKGKDIGLCVEGALEVGESEIKNPLKPLVRIATEEDLARADELAERGEEALARFRELVEKHELDMKPAAVEFLFDGAHATFFFTAEERIDFRGLVRDLASEFKVRVDMRQVGVRDEARMLGGFGHCGEPLCCTRMGGEFQPVTIRMAKEQDLPLNPAKISGLCGRLMCCLRYEFEAYKDFKGRAPKKNALIDTPLGLAKVVEFDTPRETIRVRFEDGKSVTLPVSALDTGDKEPKPGENLRPCHISAEKFDQIIEELNQDKTLAMMGDKLFSSDPALADTTAKAGAVERTPRRRRARKGQGEGSSAEPSSRSKQHGEKEPAPRDARKRRRSVSATSGDKPVREQRDTEASGAQGKQEQAAKQGTGNKRRRRRGGRGRGGSGAQQQAQGQQQTSKPRPGQHSSTVSGDAAQQRPASGDGAAPAKKRRRRRGGRGRGKGTGGGGDKPQSPAPSGE